MAYVNSTRAPGVSYRERLAGPLASLRLAIGRRRMYSRTLRELAGLSDRELNDLGIARASIAQIAHEAAYGK